MIANRRKRLAARPTAFPTLRHARIGDGALTGRETRDDDAEQMATLRAWRGRGGPWPAWLFVILLAAFVWLYSAALIGLGYVLHTGGGAP